MAVIVKTRSALSRLNPVWIMWGISVCCVLYVVMISCIPGGTTILSEEFEESVTRVHEHAARLSKYLDTVNALSPIGVLDHMKKHHVGSVGNVSDATSPCAAALDVFFEALKSGNIWALQMVDASSKIPDGLLGGNLVDLGAYDECVDITVQEDVGVSFAGQHCLVVLQLQFTTLPSLASSGVLDALGNSLAYTFSLCLPSSCSPEALAHSLAPLADDVNYLASSDNLSIQFSIQESDCHVKDRPPFDTAEVIGIVVTLCCVIVVAISTIIDLTLVYQNGATEQRELVRCLKVMTAFSVYTNGRRLFDTRVPDDSLPVLHALKFLSIAWVAAGHRAKFSVQAPLTNLLKLADYIQNWSSMIILNATLSVDVFFLISGILNTYGYMTLARRRGTTMLSHIVGYVHRYIRLTPAYALMILVTSTWLYRTNDGPLWDRLVGDARTDCTQYWWSGLLYINNYYNPNSNCMMQSWYLAADMQLFWLSPLVLYPLWRWPLLGLMNLLVLVVASIIVPFLVAYIDVIKTPIPISFDQAKVNREMAELYFPTHTKTVSYVIGILAGYYLHLLRTGRVTLRISWTTNVILWILAKLSMGYGLFGGYWIFQLDSPYDPWQSSLYIGVYRFFWSIGLAWIIVACSTGYGGFINKWLSVRGLAPLGRLTYCIYLTHVAVILYGIGSLRQPQHFTYYEMILKFLGEFVISTFLAIVLSLTIEAPIMVLEKIIMNDKRTKKIRSPSTSRKISTNGQSNADSSHIA